MASRDSPTVRTRCFFVQQIQRWRHLVLNRDATNEDKRTGWQRIHNACLAFDRAYFEARNSRYLRVRLWKDLKDRRKVRAVRNGCC